MAAEVNLYFVAWMNGGLWFSVRRAFEISFAIKNHETYRYGRIDRDTWKTGGVNRRECRFREELIHNCKASSPRL
jgi:hypothetical protein